MTLELILFLLMDFNWDLISLICCRYLFLGSFHYIQFCSTAIMKRDTSIRQKFKNKNKSISITFVTKKNPLVQYSDGRHVSLFLCLVSILLWCKLITSFVSSFLHQTKIIFYAKHFIILCHFHVVFYTLMSYLTRYSHYPYLFFLRGKKIDIPASKQFRLPIIHKSLSVFYII